MTKTQGLLAVALFCASVATATAHHSFAAQFDRNKPITLTGTLTGMRWSNPHAWIYIDVKDEDGNVVNWAFETGSANQLYRRGWRKDDLAIGAVVVIQGFLARNGTPTANARSIRFPDGREVFAGSPETPDAP